jgi:hypothetical protein
MNNNRVKDKVTGRTTMNIVEQVIAATDIAEDDNAIVETLDAADLIARNERLMESMED